MCDNCQMHGSNPNVGRGNHQLGFGHLSALLSYTAFGQPLVVIGTTAHLRSPSSLNCPERKTPELS